MKVKKQNKLYYYIYNYALLFFGKKNNSFKKEITRLKAKLTDIELENVIKRVNYYCKENNEALISKRTFIENLRQPKTPKAYYFDTYQYARFFNHNLPMDFVFGDVIHIPETFSIVKSRPISENNPNSVLLNLDKARHFVWIKNDKPFSQKENTLIGRASIYQKHRFDFYEKYFGHPLCNLGQVNLTGGNPDWIKPKISLKKHLNYKFILSLQGNDVATNLKWIMSSNSIAVMPKPTIETWFMEGTLIGGVHYIEIKSDYSDLEEQLNFYINNPKKCEEILKNAHQHCQQFFNKNVEDLCSLLVLEKYFNI